MDCIGKSPWTRTNKHKKQQLDFFSLPHDLILTSEKIGNLDHGNYGLFHIPTRREGKKAVWLKNTKWGISDFDPGKMQRKGWEDVKDFGRGRCRVSSNHKGREASRGKMITGPGLLPWLRILTEMPPGLLSANIFRIIRVLFCSTFSSLCAKHQRKMLPLTTQCLQAFCFKYRVVVFLSENL